MKRLTYSLLTAASVAIAATMAAGIALTLHGLTTATPSPLYGIGLLLIGCAVPLALAASGVWRIVLDVERNNENKR